MAYRSQVDAHNRPMGKAEKTVQKDSQLAALLARAAHGDRGAFQQLFECTCGRMMAVAQRVLGRADLAEDALQEAYLAIWEQAARFDPARGPARGWMTAIVRRRAIDRLRASPWLRREVPEVATFAVVLDDLPESLALRQCLAKLNPRVAAIICAAYLYGMTHQELSEQTGTPLGTTKSRMRRGLAALKECLEL